MPRSPNEISRDALTYLAEKGARGSRFREMANDLDISERDLSKNLFWMEERRMVKLSTSIPAGSTFPLIVVARLTREGQDLTSDAEKFERRFPSKEPDRSASKQTYRDMLRKLRDEIESGKDIDGKTRRAALSAIDKLLALSVTEKAI